MMDNNKVEWAATDRLHLENPFQASCPAKVIQVHEKGIVLDKTVAYAEGGGQEGDTGFLEINNNDSILDIPFTDTQKGPGRMIYLNDFPSIHVDTPVYHVIDVKDRPRFKVGMDLNVRINIERRARLTISHTGIHLVLMGLEELYPDIYPRIIGCHIKDTGARLDFHVENKMSSMDMEQAQMFANRLISENIKMKTFPHKHEPEAYYWQLSDTIYPCGGTHLMETSAIGNVLVKKKNLGKNKQRVSFTFPNAILPINHYYYHE